MNDNNNENVVELGAKRVKEADTPGDVSVVDLLKSAAEDFPEGGMTNVMIVGLDDDGAMMHYCAGPRFNTVMSSYHTLSSVQIVLLDEILNG